MILWLILAASLALADWWAVDNDHPRVETVAKPLVMVALIGVALTIEAEPASARLWFAAALLAGLIGDVLLLPAVDRFLGGLAAFLVGHGLYLAGLAPLVDDRNSLLVGLAVGMVLLTVLGRPIINSVRSTPFAAPVTLYIAVVGGVVTLAVATDRWLIGLGAVAFALSDTLLGSDRFVTPRPARRVWVHRLYHLGQAGLILGLDPDILASA